jgi:hypothetical protein
MAVVICIFCGERRPSALIACPCYGDRLREWSREEIKEMMAMDRIPALDDIKLNEILPVTDDVRAMAEADVQTHLNAAIHGVCAAIELTYNDALFAHLVAGLRELKAAQYKSEGKAE